MSKTKYIFIILFILIKGSLVSAQSNPVNTFELEANDILKPQINCLYQNSNGLILCGTSNGLYNFDGFSFNEYPSELKNNNNISAIFEDKTKKTWIGYSNGAIGQLINGKIFACKFPEGVPKVAITSFMQEPSGTIWMATAGEGIYYYTNNRWFNINTDDGLSDNYVYKIIYTSGYGIVAATDRGINFCNISNGKKNISNFTSINGLPDNIVRNIFLSPQKKLLTGMQDGGIGIYNGKNKSFTLFPAWKYGTVNDITSTLDHIYVATDSSLIVYSNPNGSNSTTQSSSNKTIPKTTCLLKDREENIWVAGENLLMRISTIHAQNIYPISTSISDQVHCLYSCSDTCLWFNRGAEIIKMVKNNGVWQNKKYNLPLLQNAIVSSIYKDWENNIWIGTMGKGLVLLNPITGFSTRIFDSFLTKQANIIHITGLKNIIWISALEGVVKAEFKNKGYTYTDYTDTAGIGNKYVYDIFTDSKGRTWFGTDGNGIYLLENGKFSNLKIMSGYLGNVVYEIHEDAKGNIWYATFDKGVVHFDGKTFTSYTAENGLSDASVSGLVKLGIYIAILHKNSIDIINCFNNRFITLDKTKNVSSINTDLNAYASNSINTFYFAGNDGIYEFMLPENSVQSPSVFINGMDLFLRNIPLENGRTFKYNENNLSFSYMGIYYSQPELIHYQYKLEGYDKDWVNTNDKIKNFARLPTGHYTFRVRVSLNKNFTSAAECDYSFIIESPFWLKWWFILICIIISSTIIFLFIKYREKQIKKFDILEKEKVESQLEVLRSQINPHFLFNSFNTLVSEIENNPDIAITYTEKLSDFYRSIVMYRDKDLITLSEELEVLNNYYYLQKKRYSNGLSLNINLAAENQHSDLIAPLVLQMLVENAIKHNIISTSAPLVIDIFMEGDDYIVVKNNINLKIQPEKGSGMGIENIRKRYAYLSKKELLFDTIDQSFISKIPIIKNNA